MSGAPWVLRPAWRTQQMNQLSVANPVPHLRRKSGQCKTKLLTHRTKETNRHSGQGGEREMPRGLPGLPAASCSLATQGAFPGGMGTTKATFSDPSSPAQVGGGHPVESFLRQNRDCFPPTGRGSHLFTSCRMAHSSLPVFIMVGRP